MRQRVVKRLYVLAEGQTEEEFLSLVVAPHLWTFGVFLQPTVIETGISKRSGGKERGGFPKYASIVKDINNRLHDCRFKEVWLTTMLDFYPLRHDLPGFESLPAAAPLAKVQHLEAALQQEWASHPQGGCFIPYLQLHEFETLLLCDVDAFGSQFVERSEVKGIEALKKEVSRFSPEEINGEEATAPSKRIIRHLPSYEYSKKTYGSKIAQHIGLDKMRDSCPHFDDWITRLETLVGE